MTKNGLAEKLDELDPGARLAVAERELAGLFGGDRITHAIASRIEAFAEQHRCTFSQQEHDPARPEFVKNEIF